MKYIDAEKLKNLIDKKWKELADKNVKVGGGKWDAEISTYLSVLRLITSLQQEQPMPDSTKLIELWHDDKEKLKEKDFRDDPWRLAYNAFMCGFGRGIAVKQQEQPEVDLWKEIHRYFNPHGMSLQFDRSKGNTILKPDQLFNFARHFYELRLNARKEE